MRPADFAGIVRQVRGHTDHLSLHVLGEPLLHPNLDQILASCQECGLLVNLTTNATLLPERQALLLESRALRQINISLHSVMAQGGGAPALKDYLSGIFVFIRQAIATSQLFISLRLWNTPEAANITVNSSPNSLILQEIAAFFALPGPLPATLTPGQGIPLAPRVFLSQNASFTWPHDPASELGDHGFCRGLRDHVAILVDGTVVPCCLDAEADIALGNIRQQPLHEILASPRALLLYKGFSQRRLVEPLCRRCTFRQSF
jgi:radical SAM protein with 4Fe4S-binding SPASM domain